MRSAIRVPGSLFSKRSNGRESMTERRAAYIKLLAGVAAISVSALMVRQVTMAPTVSAFWRVFYAAVMVYMLHLWALHRGTPAGDRHDRAWMLPAFLAGLFLAIDLVIWHKSIIDIGPGPATFLGNSQVIFVTIFGALIFREKIGRFFPLAIPVALTGLYLMVPSFPVEGLRSTAYVMGLTVGLTYAGFLICLRYSRQSASDKYPEALSLSFIMLVTAVFIGIWGAAKRSAGRTGYSVFCIYTTSNVVFIFLPIFLNRPHSMKPFFCGNLCLHH